MEKKISNLFIRKKKKKKKKKKETNFNTFI